MKFETFVMPTKDQDPVLVNLERVRCVKRVKNGTLIEFDNEHRVVVTMDFAVIADYFK